MLYYLVLFTIYEGCYFLSCKVNVTYNYTIERPERHKAKAIMGDKELGLRHKREILLANSEAHRFAIAYHKNMRGKRFLDLGRKRHNM